MAFDLEAIKAAHVLSDYIGQYVKLKRQGSEYVGLSPFNKEKTPSFYVVDAKGFWHDFSSGKHGDLIDFVCEYFKVDLTRACEILGGKQQAPNSPVTPRSKPEAEPSIVPADIPDSHEPFQPGEPIRAWNPRGEPRWVTYKPDYVWPYTTPDGDLLGYVLRLNLDGGRKIIVPLRPALYGDETRWTVAVHDRPRPLYNIAHAAPKGPLIICEGEKPADALTRIMGAGHLSWYGGTNGVQYTDFSPIQGRDVIIWGDADATGEKAAQIAARMAHDAGARTVRLIPWDTSKEAGWDAADAEHEGWEALDVYTLIGSARKYEYVAATLDQDPAANLDDDAPDLTDDQETPIEGIFEANPFSGELPPPRPWAFGRILLHKTVTAITAPPGTGKSTWAIQLAIAFSQNMKFGEFEPHRTGPAWVWNNEDDGDELLRRTLAACIAMDINPSDLDGRLYLNSGSDRQLIIAKEHGKYGVIATPDVDRVIEIIKAKGIKLLVVDPFAETFEVESENSNDVMKKVAKLYRDISQAADCSVLIITHPPKGTNSDRNAGSLDAIRGGGAIGGVVRSAWTMFEMSEDDAEANGVEPGRRHYYIRLDSAKANMTLKTAETSWWMREGIALNNAADGYPEDVVGTLRPVLFSAPEPRKLASDAQYIEGIADEIIRICEKNGHTSAGHAATLNALMTTLDPEKTRVKATKSRDLIQREIAPYFVRDGRKIIVQSLKKGAYLSWTVHIEK